MFRQLWSNAKFNNYFMFYRQICLTAVFDNCDRQLYLQMWSTKVSFPMFDNYVRQLYQQLCLTILSTTMFDNCFDNLALQLCMYVRQLRIHVRMRIEWHFFRPLQGQERSRVGPVPRAQARAADGDASHDTPGGHFMHLRFWRIVCGPIFYIGITDTILSKIYSEKFINKIILLVVFNSDGNNS
jgi:hypothetical protein